MEGISLNPSVTSHIVPRNPEELARQIEELGPWFHNLNLRGIQTAPNHFLGDYPQTKWHRFAHALPADLSGKSVLDIGCNAGFYSFEMKNRGAERVVAVDADERYLAQARFAAAVKGIEVEFRQMSVYDVAELNEKFDLVLFMGVIYHLRHPLLALDLLYEHVVGDLLVFQSLLRGSKSVLQMAEDYPFAETEIFERSDFPLMYFIENKYSGDETNWWIPNRAGAEAMLRSAGFEIIDHPETEVFICRSVQR
jgi:tRNA (mo5U34)-methyltransferase